jgi:hypothetical protein
MMRQGNSAYGSRCAGPSHFHNGVVSPPGAEPLPDDVEMLKAMWLAEQQAHRAEVRSGVADREAPAPRSTASRRPSASASARSAAGHGSKRQRCGCASNTTGCSRPARSPRRPL